MDNNKPTKNVFKHEELLGHPVHSLLHGNGFITKIDFSDPLPILCKFGDKEGWFTKDGVFSLSLGRLPILSFGHKEPVEFDYGESFVAPKPLEPDSIDWSDSNQTKYFVGVQHSNTGDKQHIILFTSLRQTVGVDYYTKEDVQRLVNYHNYLSELKKKELESEK